MKIKEIKVLEVPKELCSQAVIDWYENGHGSENQLIDIAKSDVRQRARKHLSAVGWTFFYAKKYNRFELRYTSPSGKCHYSLRTACKTCIDEGDAVAVTPECLAAEKVSIFYPENSPKKSSSSAPGKSPIESSNSNFNSDASPPRKRGIDFDEQSTIDQNSGDLKVGPLLSESPNSIVTSVFDVEPSQNSKISEETHIVTNNKKRLRKQPYSGKKRVKKIPRITGFFLQPKQNPNSYTRVSILSQLIDNNVVELGAKVSYKGKQYSSGEITRDGIQCHCCSVVFTLTAYEDHVGSTNHRPAAYIVLEDGRSLMDCKKHMNGNINRCGHINRKISPRSGNKSYVVIDGNDEICGFCRFGGELVLCDRCPAAYHMNCLGYETIPEGDWFCPSCLCLVCGEGKFEGEEEDDQIGGLETCSQCERKFHMGCLRDLRIGTGVSKFCSRECESVCLGLRNLVGKPIRVGPDNGLTWTLLKSSESDTRVRGALSVMHQSFEPAKDPVTQRDIVEDVMFGRESELSRVDFGGFYVVVLEKDNELVTVASVRIHGTKFAEMPLVATAFEHRRLGMCRVLVDELEKKLLDLGVERLTLPAASVVLETWVNSFGFLEMSDGDRLGFLGYNLVDFQGTFMCQKLLVDKTIKSEAKVTSPVMEDLHEDKDVLIYNNNNNNNYSSCEVGISDIYI